jgi:hypothetical protein
MGGIHVGPEAASHGLQVRIHTRALQFFSFAIQLHYGAEGVSLSRTWLFPRHMADQFASRYYRVASLAVNGRWPYLVGYPRVEFMSALQQKF